MAKRDILKEAIADAKAVKEVAIANAKAALEEAFTPKLKSLLATRIEEMDEAEDEKANKKEKIKERRRPSLDMRHDTKGTEEYKSEYEDDPKHQRRFTVEEDEIDEEVDLDEILAELETEITEADESEAERADVDKYEYEEV